MSKIILTSSIAIWGIKENMCVIKCREYDCGRIFWLHGCAKARLTSYFQKLSLQIHFKLILKLKSWKCSILRMRKEKNDFILSFRTSFYWKVKWIAIIFSGCICFESDFPSSESLIYVINLVHFRTSLWNYLMIY